MLSLASYCWIKSKPVVMLDTSVKEHLSYSSARLSESALWKMTLKADSGPWLTVGGKRHTGGEVLMGWKSCSLWSLSPGQSEKQSAADLPLASETVLGWLFCRYMYIHLHALCTKHPRISVLQGKKHPHCQPLSGLHCKHALGYAQPLQKRLLCYGFQTSPYWILHVSVI